MKKYKILALFGKSGAGKDTVQKHIVNETPFLFNGIVSCTTRPQRELEKNGEDYHFISIEEFTRKVLDGSMLEATEFRGWFYGTQLEALDKNQLNIGVFNIEGIAAMLEDSRLEVFPVLVYAPDKTRLLRQLKRETMPDCLEICRRFQTDEKDFSNFDFTPFFIFENYDEEDLTNSTNLLLDKLADVLED